MPYKDRTLRLLSRRIGKLTRAIQQGRVYVSRSPEAKEVRAKRKLYWRLVQACQHRLKALKRQQRIRASIAEQLYRMTPEYRAWVREGRAIHRLNRKVRKRSAGGVGLTTGIRKKLFFLQKGRCAACHTRLKAGGPSRYHLDHIEPLALGGPHEDVNMQLLCQPCNVAKGALPPLVYMQRIGRLL